MLNRVFAAVALALTAGGGMPALGYTRPQVTANASKKSKRNLFTGQSYGSWAMLYGTKGAGITMAQQKRAAKKRRNVKRHRAACRG